MELIGPPSETNLFIKGMGKVEKRTSSRARWKDILKHLPICVFISPFGATHEKVDGGYSNKSVKEMQIKISSGQKAQNISLYRLRKIVEFSDYLKHFFIQTFPRQRFFLWHIRLFVPRSHRARGGGETEPLGPNPAKASHRLICLAGSGDEEPFWRITNKWGPVVNQGLTLLT